MNEENDEAKFIGSIAKENIEGLAKLAEEKESEEMRSHPIRRKVKRLYRRYFTKPEAEPVEV